MAAALQNKKSPQFQTGRSVRQLSEVLSLRKHGTGAFPARAAPPLTSPTLNRTKRRIEYFRPALMTPGRSSRRIVTLSSLMCAVREPFLVELFHFFPLTIFSTTASACRRQRLRLVNVAFFFEHLRRQLLRAARSADPRRDVHRDVVRELLERFVRATSRTRNSVPPARRSSAGVDVVATRPRWASRCAFFAAAAWPFLRRTLMLLDVSPLPRAQRGSH